MGKVCLQKDGARSKKHDFFFNLNKSERFHSALKKEKKNEREDCLFRRDARTQLVARALCMHIRVKRAAVGSSIDVQMHVLFAPLFA